MGRWVAGTVVVGLLVGVVQAILVNYATGTAPAWLADQVRVWLVLAVATLAAVVVELLLLWPRAPRTPPDLTFTATTPGSLRRVPVEVRPRGRDTEVATVLDVLAKPRGRFVVVCGAGGMGKTTLAAVVAEQAERDGRSVFWIRWDRETLATQMIEVATALGLPSEEVDAAQRSGASLSDLVWRRLATVDRWLVVLDNVDQPQELSTPGEPLSAQRGWIRRGGRGLLLVTSRDRLAATWGQDAVVVDLDPLPPESATRVLTDLAPHAGTEAEARTLAVRLGGLPLALRAVGAMLSSKTARTRTFAAYQVQDVIPNVTDPAQARALVGHTWELSLDQLTEEGHEVARPLLRCLSLLAEAPIPRDLITAALLPMESTTTAVDNALAGLHQYGLIDAPTLTRTSSVPTVVLHPLVRESSRQLLARTGEQWGAHVESHLLAYADALVDQGRSAVPTLRLVTPHLLELPSLESHDLDLFVPARNVLDRVAELHDDFGEYTVAAPLRQRVLDAETLVLGETHDDVLSSRTNLATTWTGLGRHIEAAAIHERTLAARRQKPGEDHPDTLAIQNNLAVTWSELGRHDDAVELHERTLATRRRVLGETHPDTLRSQNNLANAWVKLDRHTEASETYQHVLEAHRRLLGDDHPDTLASQNNLASTWRLLGRQTEAAELHERTLDTRRRVLGETHPDTLASQNNLANVWLDLARFADAVALYRSTLEARVRLLGEDHPDTLRSRKRLAVAERMAQENGVRGGSLPTRWRAWRRRFRRSTRP